MPVDPTSPEVLVSVADEIQAGAIVGALADHGIRARVIGGYTSGFKAEAPGQVSVVVQRADVARAAKVLGECRREPAEIDWTTVDVGDDQPPPDQEDRPTGEDIEPASESLRAASDGKRGRFQFGIARLLVLQTVVSLALAVGRVFLYAEQLPAVIVFGTAYTLFGVATAVLIVGGTVSIASDLSRARQVWKYVGRALAVGLVVFGLSVLTSMILQ